MKTKSKLASDIKKLVLEKAQVYSRNKEENSDSEETTEQQQKITDAEKEKKREKMRKKKQMKREARAKSVKKDDTEAKLEALNYLRLFDSDRESWSFKKKQQVWLLSNAFNFENISDDDFKIFLGYILDLKGAAKQRLIDHSEKVIEAYEESPTSSNSDTASAGFERARSILQILV